MCCGNTIRGWDYVHSLHGVQVAHEFDRPHSAYMLFYERSEELEPIEKLQRAASRSSPAEPLSSGVQVRTSCCYAVFPLLERWPSSLNCLAVTPSNIAASFPWLSGCLSVLGHRNSLHMAYEGSLGEVLTSRRSC